MAGFEVTPEGNGPRDHRKRLAVNLELGSIRDAGYLTDRIEGIRLNGGGCSCVSERVLCATLLARSFASEFTSG